MELAAVVLASVMVTFAGCGGSKPSAPSTQAPAAAPAASAPAGTTPTATPAPAPASPADDGTPPLPPSKLDSQLPVEIREALEKPFTGDLDGMVKRRLVRVGVTYNRTLYFVDGGVQRGVAYDYGQLVEQRLNEHFKTGNSNKVHVVFMPLPRETLFPALQNGKIDLIVAAVTVRPELQQYFDFTNPTRSNVSQVLVTGPGAPPVATLDDLSGKDVFTNEKGPYYPNLVALNEKLKAQGKPPVIIHPAPANLEDDDLLEMVNAGLIPAIVVDDYLAKFWKKVFPKLIVHDTIPLHTGGSLAVPVRKNNPQLAAALNTFMGKYGLGTAFGNQIERKYLVNTKYVKSATSETDRKKFQKVVELFRKYSEQYDLDFLLMAAQGYQESQLNQNAKSQVGAIGIMQVMPATGKDLNVGDIKQLEANIHAGVKYMRATEDKFFKNEPMDELNKGLFTFASYNAGPGRIRQLRKEAEKRGLNPNLWFGNVEQIASERIGRETVTYVANIYKYYIAYRLVLEESQRREAARGALKKAVVK